MQQRSCRCVMYRKRWVKCRLEVNTAIGRSSSTIPDPSTAGAVWGISRMFDCKSIHIHPQTPFNHPPLSHLLPMYLYHQNNSELTCWKPAETSAMREENMYICGLNQQRTFHFVACRTWNRSFLLKIHVSIQFSQYDKSLTLVLVTSLKGEQFNYSFKTLYWHPLTFQCVSLLCPLATKCFKNNTKEKG